MNTEPNDEQHTIYYDRVSRILEIEGYDDTDKIAAIEKLFQEIFGFRPSHQPAP